MITAKTLSGNIITLEASNKKEFEYAFKKKYIKEKFRPFVTVTFLENEKDDEKDIHNINNIHNIIINLHKILPFMENDKFFPEKKWEFLTQNKHPEAVKIVLEKFKKQINDENEYEYIDIIDDILDKEHASEYLIIEYGTEFENVNNINIGFLEGLASNPDTKVLELLFNFESEFENDPQVWINLASNKNPLVLNKIIKKMNRDKWFKEDFDFCEIGLSNNKESIEFLLENLDLIEKCDHHKNKIHFSGNPYATYFLIENKDKIEWKAFSKNNHPDALKFLKKNEKKVSIENLALNESKEAIDFLENLLLKLDDYSMRKKTKKINENLHKNPFAISILSDYYSYNIKSLSLDFMKKSPILWSNSGIFCPDIDSEDIYL